MKVLVTGAAGHIGRRLTSSILACGSLRDVHGEQARVTRLIACDIKEPRSWTIRDPRCEFVVGDLADSKSPVQNLVSEQTDSIFHVATATSGDAESDFDLGIRANLDSIRNLLEACRSSRRLQRFIFTSSLAVFGTALPNTDRQELHVRPTSSYGTQKAIGELLVNDYSRRGFIDGCSLRIPTIFVRPDQSLSQATDFASHMVREVIAGREVDCPVDPSTPLFVLSPELVISSLIEAHDMWDGSRRLQGAHTLPGMTIRAADIVVALSEITGVDQSQRIRFHPTPPGKQDLAASFHSEPAFLRDGSIVEILRKYLSERAV